MVGYSPWGHKESDTTECFLELSCFFKDPMDVGNLISDASAFNQLEHQGVHASCIAEAWLGEL